MIHHEQSNLVKPYQGLCRNGIEGHLMIVLSMMMLMIIIIMMMMIIINMQLWSQNWVVKSMLAELKNSQASATSLCGLSDSVSRFQSQS